MHTILIPQSSDNAAKLAESMRQTDESEDIEFVRMKTSNRTMHSTSNLFKLAVVCLLVLGTAIVQTAAQSKDKPSAASSASRPTKSELQRGGGAPTNSIIIENNTSWHFYVFRNGARWLNYGNLEGDKNHWPISVYAGRTLLILNCSTGLTERISLGLTAAQPVLVGCVVHEKTFGWRQYDLEIGSNSPATRIVAKLVDFQPPASGGGAVPHPDPLPTPAQRQVPHQPSADRGNSAGPPDAATGAEDLNDLGKQTR